MSASLHERFGRVDTVFDGALDLPAAERAAFVTTACGDDAELRDDVLRLLRAHEQSAGFLESPALELAAPLLPDAIGAPPLPLGGRVGPFRLVREIGHGGMGTVFLAERESGEFQQRVALKLIRADGYGEAFVRRFIEERRILALLEHPGIARLVDGGITGERVPWFAMEYVEGEPIDRYCDARRLDIADRLKLFARVCDAVQYAHRHLIVHRDLKPANILVSGDGQVKLLDFGIARLLGDPASRTGDATTLLGGRVMTPEYASPEQVRGLPATTGTDVYALGVLLYQMLAGVRPYTLHGRSAAEIERIVCDVDAPLPSSTFAQGEERAGDRAVSRRASPDRVRRTLRGDLDLIVLTALHKDPALRYASPAALREDLQRWTDGLPIAARPPRATYRLGRFVRRHRPAVAAALALLVLLAGTAVRERALRSRAEAETQKARAVEEFLVSVFDLADPFAPPVEGGAEVTARALLDQGAARIDAELATEPAVRAELRGVLGRVFTSLGLFDRAVPMLERALAEQRALHGAEDAAVADAMDRLGVALTRQDRHTEADSLLRAALDVRRRVLGDNHPATAASLDNLAELHQARNDYASADSLFRQALAITRAQPEPDDLAIASVVGHLALLRWSRGEFSAADSLYREVYAIERERLGEDHPKTAQTLHNMAQAAQLLGDIERSDTLYRAALAAKRASLGNAHPSVTINLNNLGRMLAQNGRPDEAEPLIREALALDRRIFGDRHSYVGQSLNNLGLVLRMRGEFDEAERTYRESLALNRDLLGEEHSFVALNWHEIASVLYLKGDLEGAIPLYRRSHELYVKLLGEAHMSPIVVGNNLARALREGGRPGEALAIFETALTRLDRARPQDRAAWAVARLGLGQILAGRGALTEARTVLEDALDVARAQFGGESLRTAENELALGECLLELGAPDEAAPLIEHAATVLRPQQHSQPRLAAQAESALTRLERIRGQGTAG